MQTYHNLLGTVLRHGLQQPNRTGVDTLAVYGHSFHHHLSSSHMNTPGFPLLTTKRIHFKSVAVELLWMLSGAQDVQALQVQGVSIWDEWAYADGGLGRIYGPQWRDFRDGRVSIDQIVELEKGLQRNPHSRRHVVTAWNPHDLELNRAALPPCHILFQLHVVDRYLHLTMYQRSADIFLGVPFNIASYALLLSMLAHVHGYRPGLLTIHFGDLHLYVNHIEQAQTQLARPPRYLPTLSFRRCPASILDFTYDDIELKDYSPASAIPAPVAV